LTTRTLRSRPHHRAARTPPRPGPVPAHLAAPPAGAVTARPP
jgi:hypothetical protein